MRSVRSVVSVRGVMEGSEWRGRDEIQIQMLLEKTQN